MSTTRSTSAVKVLALRDGRSLEWPETVVGELARDLVYAASGSVVDTTVVAGRVLMRGGVVEGAEEIVAQAAERARRFETQHGTAQLLQRSMLPEHLPELDRFRIAMDDDLDTPGALAALARCAAEGRPVRAGPALPGAGLAGRAPTAARADSARVAACRPRPPASPARALPRKPPSRPDPTAPASTVCPTRTRTRPRSTRLRERSPSPTRARRPSSSPGWRGGRWCRGPGSPPSSPWPCWPGSSGCRSAENLGERPGTSWRSAVQG